MGRGSPGNSAIKKDKAVSLLTRNLSTHRVSRVPLCALAMVIGVSIFSADQAQAGVILPWMSDDIIVESAVAVDGGGMAAPREREVDADRESDPPQRANTSGRVALASTQVDYSGGASSPSGGSGAQGSVLTAAFALVAGRLASTLCTYGRLAELTPVYPQPPPSQLLRPPRA